MSDFGEVADQLLQEIEAALSPTVVELQRGFRHPNDVSPSDSVPVFAMIYNPEESSEQLDDAQLDRVVQYRCLLVRRSEPMTDDPATGVRRSPAFDKMAADVDAVRDQLQRTWPPDPGPLGGLVEVIRVTERAVDEVIDLGKVYGVLLIETTEVTVS